MGPKRPPLVAVDGRGLACEAGGFHVDPWRPVARAIVTHAHSDHARLGAESYLCTRESLPLLRRRLPGATLHGVAYGERVRVGAVTISLHPAGHVLGSAQVRIEHRGEVWVVSGDYKRASDPTCLPFEPVRCDTFITEATFGLPIYRWPSPATVAREIRDWWLECRADGRTALLGCYALGKSQRVLAELARLTDAEKEPVHLHGAVASVVDAYREAGVPLPATERVILPSETGGRGKRAALREGSLVLAPPSALGSTWATRFGPVSTALASGWMAVRGTRRRRNVDRGFVLSDHADWPGLVDTAKETGAGRVLVTHGDTAPLVRYLGEHGIAAAPLATQYEGEVNE